MKSVKEQLKDSKGKVVWLSSYPKSGNTWLRCFLSALIDKEVNINRPKTDTIFSSRHIFDVVHDLDSRLMSEAELKLRMQNIYKHYVKNSESLRFIKVHDAYTKSKGGKALFPIKETKAVIYLVRNPLDIVASFANHLNRSIEVSLNLMNNKSGYLARQPNGLNNSNQLPQLMQDWSGHVNSWISQKDIPVTIVKYEDMKHNGFETFSRIVKAIGLKVSDEMIHNSIKLSKFDNLKKAEKSQGFKEKTASSKNFFRKGKVGGWKNELNNQQIESILDHHGEMMKKLSYEIPKF